MTLNTRNKFILSIMIVSFAFFLLFSIILIVNLVNGISIENPGFERIINMGDKFFLFNNNINATIISVLTILLLIGAFSFFLYAYFEKTKSPETIYLVGFLFGCFFQCIKIVIILSDLWKVSSLLMILIGKVEILGRIFASLCLLFTAMLSDHEQVQETDKNIGIAFGVSLLFALLFPINTTKIFSNLTISNGFDTLIYVFIIFTALITFAAFMVASKQRFVNFKASPSPYFLIMFIGYLFLILSDNYLFLILGLPLFIGGSYGMLSSMRKYYLWK